MEATECRESSKLTIDSEAVCTLMDAVADLYLLQDGEKLKASLDTPPKLKHTRGPT